MHMGECIVVVVRWLPFPWLLFTATHTKDRGGGERYSKWGRKSAEKFRTREYCTLLQSIYMQKCSYGFNVIVRFFSFPCTFFARVQTISKNVTFQMWQSLCGKRFVCIWNFLIKLELNWSQAGANESERERERNISSQMRYDAAIKKEPKLNKWTNEKFSAIITTTRENQLFTRNGA